MWKVIWERKDTLWPFVLMVFSGSILFTISIFLVSFQEIGETLFIGLFSTSVLVTGYSFAFLVKFSEDRKNEIKNSAIASEEYELKKRC